MEIFDLRYFLAVAKHENIHRAAQELHVSPGSLSKSLARLEEELQVKLFQRISRNIRLNSHGQALRLKASDILERVEDARLSIRGKSAHLHVIIAGHEVLLGRAAFPILQSLRQAHAESSFELIAAGNQEVLDKVEKGEAHLGLVTSEIPGTLTSKRLFASKFQTCIGPKHPLQKMVKGGKSVPVQTVLEHEFVVPSSPILGTVSDHQSADGWRDDKFPRRVGYTTSSLRLLERLVSDGKAVAYLPDYYVQELGLTVLTITGCPYSCKQEIHLVARSPERLGWLNRLF